MITKGEEEEGEEEKGNNIQHPTTKKTNKKTKKNKTWGEEEENEEEKNKKNHNNNKKKKKKKTWRRKRRRKAEEDENNNKKENKNIRKYGGIFENMICINLRFRKIMFLEMLDQIWKRRAPTHNEDPSQQISKLLNMRSRSIKNMKWKFGKSSKLLEF